MGLRIEHRQHKGLNNRAENFHLPTRRREQIMKRFKSPRQVQKFLSIHDQVANLFHFPRNKLSTIDYRAARAQAFSSDAVCLHDPFRRAVTFDNLTVPPQRLVYRLSRG
jgi:putative transposase